MISDPAVFASGAALVKVLCYLVLMGYAYKYRNVLVGLFAFGGIAINYFNITGQYFFYIAVSSATAPLACFLLITFMIKHHRNRKD